MPTKGGDRRRLRLAQGIEGARQEHRHGLRGGESRRVRVVRVFDVIGRERTVACREERSADVGQLFGMELHRQAKRPGGIEHPRHLRGVKGDALAEPVDRIDQPLGMGRMQRGDADLVDVSIRPTRVVGGHRMGAEE